MNENGNDRIFGAVFGLLEWTFQVSLTSQDKAIIESEVFRGWDNGDRTDHELIAYLLQLHKMIWGVSQRKRDLLRQQARDIFKREFANAGSEDRGRILATMQRILEGASNGVTGVASAAARSGPAIPHLTVPAHAARLPAVAPLSGPGPVFAGVPGQPALPAAAAPQSTNLGGMNDMLRQQLDAQRETEKLTMLSNIEALKHKTNMTIIGNIR